MSKKSRVVKTYGRHKHRTVKAQIWLSPDENVHSPFGNGFPSKIEASSSKNVFKPKSSKWSKHSNKVTTSRASSAYESCAIPIVEKQELIIIDDKENSHTSNSSADDQKERKFKRKRQTLFSNCTPLSTQKGSNVDSTCPSESEKSVVKTPEVVLVNDSLEIREKSTRHIHDVICVEDSVEDVVFQSGCNNPTNLSINTSNGKPNLSGNASVFSDCSSISRDGENRDLGNKDCIQLNKNNNAVFQFDSCHSTYATSTPVFNGDNYLAIGGVGQSDSQNSYSIDGKVILEPIRITPIQWEKSLLLLSSTEKPSNKKTSQLSSDEHKNSVALKTLSLTSSDRTSKEMKECVVSLEKLRITPLKKKGKYLTATLSGDGSLPFINRGKSQLSFAEALTPVKKNLTKTNFGKESEEVKELTNFEKVLMECNQERPLKFSEILDKSLLESCVKIGEGVYGEVFKSQYKNGQSIALKIIPVEGDFQVNGEPQKSFEEILPEIVISKELSLLGESLENDNGTTTFITVHSVTCIQGGYPSHLISEWDKWDTKHTSENDKPDIFPSDQFFIVFEFSNGGKDLESFEFNCLSEAWSVLHQTALGLAVAENALEFEHRDLHWGNVLICKTEDQLVESTLQGEKKLVPSHGVRVSLIDFTLSRLKKDGVTVFCNMAEDESLFTGRGDYQFDVYRLMKKANKNDWEPFEPHSNVLWLHYLADKMLKKKKYPRKDKETETQLKMFLRQARKCSSATDIVHELFA
nr:uncharacterized protein LOC131788578 [Pocillopora verrucosa]